MTHYNSLSIMWSMPQLDGGLALVFIGCQWTDMSVNSSWTIKFGQSLVKARSLIIKRVRIKFEAHLINDTSSNNLMFGSFRLAISSSMFVYMLAYLRYKLLQGPILNFKKLWLILIYSKYHKILPKYILCIYCVLKLRLRNKKMFTFMTKLPSYIQG